MHVKQLGSFLSDTFYPRKPNLHELQISQKQVSQCVSIWGL